MQSCSAISRTLVTIIITPPIAYGGGTTNLKNHFRPSEYNNLHHDDENVDGKHHKIENFTHLAATVVRLAASSYHAKILTEGVIDFIVKDMHPVSTVD